MKPRTIKIWAACIRGQASYARFSFRAVRDRPALIFQEDIDQAFGNRAAPDQAAMDLPALPVDRLIAIAKAERPGEVVRFATQVNGGPLWNMEMATAVTSNMLTSIVSVDARTGRVMRIGERLRSPPIQFIKDLHTELLLGQGGQLALGVVALCFIASIVSGVVVYAPFMRRLPFGTIRATRGPSSMARFII